MFKKKKCQHCWTNEKFMAQVFSETVMEITPVRIVTLKAGISKKKLNVNGRNNYFTEPQFLIFNLTGPQRMVNLYFLYLSYNPKSVCLHHLGSRSFERSN